MIKVLHVVSGIAKPGGVQSVLKNYYSLMDKQIVNFDFVVHADKEGEIKTFFEKWGSKIFKVTPKKVNLRKHIHELNLILKNGNYDIIHTHQNYLGFISLYIAKKNKIPVRIVHCHRAFPPETLKKKILRIILSYFVKKYATHWFACGKDAAKWLYGEQSYRNGRVFIVKNAIDVNKFLYSEDKRIHLRNKLNIQEKFVLGHVGNFYNPKNHEFLIKVFAEVYKINPNSVLLLVGTGKLENKIHEEVRRLGLNDAVIFLGPRNDVHNLLNVMDVFLLPSIFEGFGIVTIEAQANGLPCVVSDRVPKEVNITNNVTYIPLHYPPIEWAKLILNNKNKRKIDNYSIIRQKGYDISSEATKLEKIYQNILAK